MPGFTAEASLYTVSRHYHSRMISISTVEVLPQLVRVIGNGDGAGRGGRGGGGDSGGRGSGGDSGGGGTSDDCMSQCTGTAPECPSDVENALGCGSWDAGFELICDSLCSG